VNSCSKCQLSCTQAGRAFEAVFMALSARRLGDWEGITPGKRDSGAVPVGGSFVYGAGKAPLGYRGSRGPKKHVVGN